MNINKKPCNLQKTKCVKFRDRKNTMDIYIYLTYICVCIWMYMCVCAILTFDFTNFIINHTFLRSISSKKKKVLRKYFR